MKKLLLTLTFALLLVCVFVVCVGAQDITTYDDAPVRVNITPKADDIVEFYDGFKCPVGYVFKDVTSIPYWNSASMPSMFDFEYIRGKTGIEYDFDDIKGFDIPEGVTYLGQYACKELKTLQWMSIPATVTTIGNAVFQGSTGIMYCYFEHGEDSSLKKFPPYMFAGCTNLQAFSMPDCITEITDVCQFSLCSNLQAVYLSKNLTKWETFTNGGGGRNATFDDCYKLYFVNEPFGRDEIPAKPTVYYFPEKLTTTDSTRDFSNECTFRNCKSLNDVLVFGKGVTKITNNYIAQASPANTVVFLGDMTKVTSSWWGTSKIIFANPNDKSADDVALTTKNGQKISFCFGADNTTHLASPLDAKITTPATCVSNAYGENYCFCGTSLGGDEIAGTALGHSFKVDLGAYYVSYMEDSYYSVGCERCDGVEKGDKAFDAIISYYGYSCTEEAIGGAYSMSQFYGVNTEALNAYAAYTGKTFEYGLVASGTSNPLTYTEGNLLVADKSFTKDSKTFAHDFFGIKINGITEDNLDKAIVFCAYVIDGDRVAYLDAGVTSKVVDGITFNDVLASLKEEK